MDLKDFAQNNKMKLLMFGDSGVGKTVAACSSELPIFVFDWDQKMSSAYQFYKKHDPKRLESIQFESYSLNKATDTPWVKFVAALTRLEQLAADGKFPFKTIVVDSLTFMTEAMMAHVVKSNPSIKCPMPGVPGMQHYGLANMEFKGTIGRLLQLPCHVIMVAHIKSVVNDQTGEIKYKPMLSGSLADYAPKIFREVYRVFVERDVKGNSKHLAQTRNDGRYECRTESPDMPMIVPLSLKEIAKYLSIEMEETK